MSRPDTTFESSLSLSDGIKASDIAISSIIDTIPSSSESTTNPSTSVPPPVPLPPKISATVLSSNNYAPLPYYSPPQSPTKSDTKELLTVHDYSPVTNPIKTTPITLPQPVRVPTNQYPPQNLAIIGGGITGLGCAYSLLSSSPSLFTTSLGGNALTLSLPDSSSPSLLKKTEVDVGFMVFNERNYPNLIKFFNNIDVQAENR